MNEDQKRKWDVSLGIVAPILTVAGILVGVWTFIEGEQNRTRLEYEMLARQSAVDFQRTLWKEQLDTYREISKLAGQIAAHDGDSARFKQLVNEFHTLYWGTMILIEDVLVEEKLVEFNVEIRDYLTGRSQPERLKTRAKRLVEACRESSEREWRKISDSIQQDL